MKKISIVLLMVMMVTLFTACHKKEDVELYSDYELPEEEQEVEEANPHYFDFDSAIDYHINDEIASKINPKEFDKEFVAFLKANEYLPDISNMNGILVAQDDGYITYGLEDETVEFDVTLWNDEETVVTCVMDKDGTYMFSVNN